MDMNRQYFEEMPCYISIQDADLRIIDSNRRFSDDFGSGIGKHCYEVYKKRSEKCDFCPVEMTFRDGRRYGSEELVQTVNGRMVSVIVYTTPIRNEKGEIVAVMEMSTDITELKILQDKLRESQDRYRLLFDEVPCYISIQDRDFNLMEVNRRFRDDFGDGAGGHCYEVYKHRKEVCSPCPVAETFQDGLVHESEEVVTSKSGDRVNVLCIAAPIYDNFGQIKYVMEMSTNITQIRNLQSQLASIGLLISSISHGLKGLLNGLDGGIYLVNSGLEKKNDDRMKKGWEMVERNVGHVRNTVMDILYYAKPREMRYETVSVNNMAEEICGILDKKAQDLGIEFYKNIDADTGEMEANLQSLRACLVNILENSFDACRVKKESENRMVSFSAKGDGDRIVFEVCDNGIGMDRETREKAFTLFFSSKGTEGTGLGLYVANHIIKQHGGAIEVQSNEGKGTRFIISLPRRQAENNVPAQSLAV